MLTALGAWLFDPGGLTPHGFCLLWEPWLIWTHSVSDLAIAAAYFSIPLALAVFVRRRRDMVFRPVLWLFAAFISLCGATHVLGLATLWVPAYGVEALVKVATAVVSVATAVLLWPMMPQALALPSPTQMRAANRALERLAEERGSAIAALRDSEARYRAGFLRSPIPLLSLDAEGTITGVSERWLELLGHPEDEVVGRPLARFLTPDDAPRAAADWTGLLAGGEARDLAWRLLRRDGETLDVLFSASVERAPVGGETWVLGAMVDVTASNRAEAALRESEEKLRQAQRMEALGQLAGGIAHDFNNVLQAVAGANALIARRAEDTATVRRLARIGTEAAERGASITRRLLAFARRDRLDAAPVPPAELLGELREVLRHTLGAGVTVAVDADPGLPPLLADRSQLETVLINLSTNARDAMPGGGRLTFAATEEGVAPDAPHPLGLAPGDYIRLEVTDTGHGMDATTLARAADPFFTTKPVGKGTGLGLSMARGFAQQSGGALALRSAPDAGTTVSLWLPRAPAAAAAAAPTPERAKTAPNGPRLLLVDDEPMIRQVLAAELADHGFTPLVAQDGNDALRLILGEEPIDLLVTDLSMPGMDGLALIREAQKRRPGLPAILLTGYAGEAATLAVAGVVSGSFTLLRKPASVTQIADRAAAMLEGQASQAGGPRPPPRDAEHRREPPAGGPTCPRDPAPR